MSLFNKCKIILYLNRELSVKTLNRSKVLLCKQNLKRYVSNYFNLTELVTLILYFKTNDYRYNIILRIMIFDVLLQCRQDYKNAYLSYLSAPTTQSLSAYFDSHNAYVQQLHATNGMLDEYSKETLPQLLQVSLLCLFQVYNRFHFL